MIIDFKSDRDIIKPGIVGGKFYHLYQLNKIDNINVPEAFCITSRRFNRKDVLKRCNFEKKYAVRSSSPQEDKAGQTAAGIFESYLNVDSEESLFKAVDDCFESVKSSKVKSYLSMAKKDNPKSEISVIIQEMIQPDKAGVLFTKNPVSGEDEYFIEMIDDLGEKLVSGSENPDRIIIKKNTLPEEPLLLELKRAAELIELKFNSAMDVEWAWSDNKLSILQARPIVAGRKSVEPHKFWTRANIGEIIPKPLTPLSWDIFKKIIFHAYRIKYYSLIDRFFTNIIHLIPRFPPAKPSPQEKNGYLYLNLDTILKSFGGEPWVDKDILELGLGFQIPADIIVPQKSLSEKIISAIKGIIFLIELILPFFSMEKRLQNFINAKIRFFSCDEDNLDCLINLTRFLFGWHIAITARCFTHLGFLKSLSRTISKEQLSNNKLISLLTNFQTDEFVPDSRLKKKIIDELQDEINLKNEGKKVNFDNHSSDFNQFMQKYGHRSVNEFELMQPGWIENYEGLIQFLQHTNYNIQVKKKDLRFSFFEGIIFRRMEKAIILREGLKSILIKYFREIRYHFLRRACRLISNGLITAKDDIFFLNLNEIEMIERDKGVHKIDLKERREKYKEYLTEQVPYNIKSGDSRDFPPDFRKEYDYLRGIGCSEGVVEGRVKILKDFTAGLNGLKDNIIITKSADPGWTPVILQAKGMITEIGGVLSHIATIAREFSVPMIVGAVDITEKLENGQLVRINGSSGIITVLDEN